MSTVESKRPARPTTSTIDIRRRWRRIPCVAPRFEPKTIGTRRFLSAWSSDSRSPAAQACVERECSLVESNVTGVVNFSARPNEHRLPLRSSHRSTTTSPTGTYPGCWHQYSAARRRSLARILSPVSYLQRLRVDS